MSNIPLSDIQELIERSIFEAIRKEVTDKGYLPDITLFPETAQGASDYFLEIPGIIANKGFIIEVVNESSNFDKGIKSVPRIVIKTGSFLSGDVGGDPLGYFERSDIGYNAKITPPQTSNYYLEIHLVSNTTEQERILNAILSLVLPKRKYLKFYNNLNKSFFIRHINFSEMDDTDHGIIQKVNYYEIPDCWEHEDIITRTNVSLITRIDLNVNLDKYYTGTLTVYDTVKGVTNTISEVTANLTMVV